MADVVKNMFDDDSDDEQYSDTGGARRRRQYSDDSDDNSDEGAHGKSQRRDSYDDDEEEEERASDRRGPKKDGRRKRPRMHNFLDIEASVDTDEEEDDDEEGALGDFIVDNEDELASAEKDALRHRKAARAPAFQADESLDADAIEAQLRERYSGYATSGARAAPSLDTEWMPQRLIIPGINDPHLWMARCSMGKERDIVLAAARRLLQWAGSGKYNNVYSVYSRDGLSGYIYVEARTQADAVAALEGIPNVFVSRMTLVPIEDMVDVVKVKARATTINVGAWVRVRRGNYAGDLAQVVSVLDSSDMVEVRMLPRLDYDNESRAGRRGPRPAPRLFSVEEAQRADPRTLSSRQNEILWRGDRFVNGYLYKDIRIASLQTDAVNPTLEEIAQFAAGETGEDGDEQAAIAALANQAAAAMAATGPGGTVGGNGIDEANGLTARDLKPGENVEVVEGDLAGVVGVVRSVEGNGVVRVEPEMGGLTRGARSSTTTMGFPARQLRKRFRTGDHVKVLHGRHANETGMVLSVADAVVTVFTDIAKSEIRVLAKDLRISSDVGAGTAAAANVMVGMDVHDLVHLDGPQMGLVLKVGPDSLTVLDDHNEVRTLAPRVVRPTRPNFQRSGVDFNGQPLKRGDAVREAAGAHRTGTIVQVTRFVTFIKPRDATSNDAIFAVRTRQVESLSTRHNSLDPYATRNTRMPNGADRGRGRGRGGGRGGGSLRGGRDPLVGKTVIANRGPYKGYVGIVKDIAGTLARIELHTNARVVSVDKDKLSVRLPSGDTIPVVDYTSSMSGSGGGGGGYGSGSYSSGGGGSRSDSRPGDHGASSGWGGPPSSTGRQPVVNSPAPSYGGWDTAGTPSAAGSGGWGVATPNSGGGGGAAGGGWDAGTGAAGTPAASGWGVAGGSAGNWATPGPITPGALPQTPGGPFPQTPGNSTGTYYDPATPGGRPAESGGADGFFGWAVPRAVVVLGSSGERGTIREVAPERQQAIVKLQSGSTQVIDRSSVARLDPRPVRAEKRDRVIVIRGSRKGALGTMVGKDGAEAFFQPQGDSAWHPEPLRNLAIYNDQA
ncbi:transcription elongation factor spt5 [Coemansia sp. RSA 552]|nr:transcription elongation factor spt5 [Coemansia sp. RSA 552]